MYGGAVGFLVLRSLFLATCRSIASASAEKKKSSMLDSRSSMARKFGQSRRHWPMLKGVWPKPRVSGSNWRKSVK